ncbi:hypothetical protein [Flavobacterium sp. SLB02]|jgi:hypothetical protein|uniref:hypothetical protein n=1 Tax=Flavobacterium sp. SLB02 TaxID=2665645 RepID=UPI0012A78674|nr:hypothetical protein [Flavobacterium sp. SLB02]QGK74666.1 hypothetical protein GIY83_11555 [Flavobacterium sp. SLB02]
MKQLSSLVCIFLFIGCNSKADITDNLTAPETFAFQILDKNTGENVFSNKTYNPKKITVKNLDSDDVIPHHFVSDNDLDIIVLENVGRESENINYSVNVGDKRIFELHVDAILVKKGLDFEYKNVEITNTVFKRDKTSGVYNILASLD